MDIQALRKMRNTDFGKITSEFEKIANPESSGGKNPTKMTVFGN